MKKILIAALVGALALFAWQFLIWAVLPVQNNTFQPFPDESQAQEANLEMLSENGTYIYPAPGAANEAVSQGPLIITFFQQDGSDRTLLWRIVIGFLLDFLVLFIICSCLRLVIDLLDNFIKRFIFLLGMGLAIIILTQLYQWNWFFFNDYYTTMLLLDHIGGWLIASAVIALLLKPVHKYILP